MTEGRHKPEEVTEPSLSSGAEPSGCSEGLCWPLRWERKRYFPAPQVSSSHLSPTVLHWDLELDERGLY